jgi:hypothetical protein
MRRLVAAVAVAAAAIGVAIAQAGTQSQISGVSSANPKAGHPANVISPGYELRPVVQGSDQLENPGGIYDTFGYLADGAPPNLEPTKTEPDQNTYLVFKKSPGGPTAGYDYGRHFLFQFHETGNDQAFVTRVNLDVKDPTHRITLLTPGDGKTTGFNSGDGSTWDPFAKVMVYTQEEGADGGAIEQSPFWTSTNPPPVTTLYGSLGRGGFEGIHPDDKGNLLIIEDSGGQTVPVDPNDPTSAKAAKQPNSYVYRFVPDNPSDLTKGKLQVLQVTIDKHPVTETCTLTATSCDSTPAQASADVFSQDQLKLHSGNSYPVRWVTIHDTDTDGTASFDANLAAKGVNNHGNVAGTPFKRPENGSFQPGTDFRTFFFVPTGDTNSKAGTPDLAARGSWGSIFRVRLSSDRSTGTLNLYALGDADHSSFDNTTFLTKNILLTAEDRGDGLHTQLNKLDSVWAWDVSKSASSAKRFLALGRDPASETDSNIGALACLGTTPPSCPFNFQNEGDNEPTGVFASDGNPTKAGLLGTDAPDPDQERVFFTQQHGENHIWEVVKG